MKTVKVFAPAKVNLTLHVTGQQKGGFHLLDSLVMFADIGDRVTLQLADETTLEVIGPMADAVPVDNSNLVMQTARLFDVPVSIILSKHLPTAAGIGGGSSDAAATALAICDLTEHRNLPGELNALGADIRVCLLRQAARMQGIGEIVTPLPGLPALYAVLVNPGVALSTPDVFKQLTQKQGKPMPKRLPKFSKTAAFIKWLGDQRNDLEEPACVKAPVIREVLRALANLSGARLARMSGSGATCFALFEKQAEAEAAALKLTATNPAWWVKPVQLS